MDVSLIIGIQLRRNRANTLRRKGKLQQENFLYYRKKKTNRNRR